jgi:hypothetical protein
VKSPHQTLIPFDLYQTMSATNLTKLSTRHELIMNSVNWEEQSTLLTQELRCQAALFCVFFHCFCRRTNWPTCSDLSKPCHDAHNVPPPGARTTWTQRTLLQTRALSNKNPMRHYSNENTTPNTLFNAYNLRLNIVFLIVDCCNPDSFFHLQKSDP